ncbi:branched-chain amino acid ABC transporter permease [soil metagenome]
MDLFLQQAVNGLVVGSGYAIFAVGFGLLFTTLGVLNIAHGMYAAIGALGAWWVMSATGLPFWAALAGGVVVGGLLGVVIDRLAFEPLRRRRAGTLGTLITSIGAWMALGSIAENIAGFQVQRFPSEAVPTTFFDIGPIQISGLQIVQIAAALIVGFGMHVYLRRTKSGLAIRAVGFDQIAAALGGVNPRRVIVVVAVISAAVAALAGILIGANTSNVSRALGDGLLFKGFAAVVIGGMGDLRGAMVAGLAIGVGEVMVSQYISTDFRDAITFGLLLLLLVLRPQGIFAEAKTSRA